jgi:hypothetical protein
MNCAGFALSPAAKIPNQAALKPDTVPDLQNGDTIMKKLLLAAVAVLSLGAAGAASAQSLSHNAPPHQGAAQSNGMANGG